MAISNTAKVGIAAAALGGIYFLTRNASASESKTDSNASNLGDIAGCAAGTKDAKAGKVKADMDAQAALATVAFSASGLTTADMPAFATAFTAAYERCYTENKIVSGGGGGGGPVLKFDSSKLSDSDKATGNALAVGIACQKAAPGTPTDKVASNGTYKNLSDFALYSPTGYMITQMQKSAHIKEDGKVGTETNKAFSYFLAIGPLKPTC